MAATATTVTQGGLAYRIIGHLRETVTDVVLGDNSEAITAAQLGLSIISTAEADVHLGITSDDAIYAKCTINASGATVLVALFTADGTAATTAATSTVRVYATGS